MNFLSWGRKIKTKFLNTRFKRIFSFFLIFALVVTSVFFLFSNKQAEASWWDNMWDYRKSVDITNNTNEEDSVYVSLTIDTSDSSKFQGDCGDLRFIKSRESSILPYYIVSGCGTNSTVIHINFDVLKAGSQTVYYYYGNPSASNGFEASDFSTEASNYSIGELSQEEESPGNPIGYWSLNEGVGSTAYDESGQENDGTIYGATWKSESECVAERCLDFDGINDYIGITNTVNRIKTINFWIKTTSSSTSFINLNASAYINSINGAVNTSGFSSSTVYVNAVESSILSSNEWQMITVVTDTAIDASDLSIGNISGNYFTGSMDEIKIYPYVRTVDQIQQDYSAGVSGISSPRGTSISFGGTNDIWVADGLVAHWKFDEGFGGTAHDSSGNGNHGTLTPGTSGTNTTATAMWDKGGKFNSAIEFDGTDDYLAIGTDESLNSGTISISVWAKSNLSGSDIPSSFYPMIINKRNTNAGTYALFANSDTDKLTLQFRLDGTEGIVRRIPTDVALDTNWHHYVGTYDGSVIKLFVDGVLQSNTISLNGAIDTDNDAGLAIGSITGGMANTYWNGKIDEVKVYNYALSADQVKTEYNGGYASTFGGHGAEADNNGTTVTGDSSKYCVPGDTAQCDPPVLELAMDEKEGNVTYDTSGNENDGILTNNPIWARGKLGSGLEFDGADDYLVTSNHFDYTDGYYQISFWIKPATFNEVGESCLIDGSSFKIKITSSGKLIFIDEIPMTNGEWSTAENLINFNSWNFVSIKGSDTSPDFYINGVKTETITDVSPSGIALQPAGQSWIIADNYQNDNGFKGILDDIKVFDYERTPAQIAWDYNRGKPIAEWRFNEGVGTTAHNSTDNTLHGTMYNTGDDDWITAGSGKALSFDGVDQYVGIGDTGLNINTLSFWVKQDYTDNHFLDLDGGTHTVTLSDGSVTTTGFTSPAIYIDGVNKTTLPDNAWHHVLIKTSTAIDVNNLNLGKVGTNYYQGSIDNLKLYSYPLTLQQIENDYNNGSSVSFSDNNYSNGSALITGWNCGDNFTDDRDSEVYATVEIGDQCWMAEDLRYECENYYPTASTWTGTECADQGTVYNGLLYQWDAAMDGSEEEGAQGLCPVGWHIPSDTELSQLTTYVGANYSGGVGDQLKDSSVSSWCYSSPCGETGWDALPGGFRDTDGTLFHVGSYGYWWSSSVGGNGAWYRALYSDYSGVYRSSRSQAYGFSVRCLRN